ncbi:cation-transporting P-type ATPase [Corallincola platygyrae]|uniref:Cation-transporting P-type ATPase n=1 Tax=Corallincola platygyrae TaxID=1193278 RepID=A0ABW4XGC7_9GAMM
MEDSLNKCWHNLPQQQVKDLLNSSIEQGLASEEVSLRKEKFGLNRITQRKGQGPLVRFLLQFHQPLVYILLAAAIVKLILGGIVDSSVIFGVVVINAVIGFLQESKALSALDALSKSLTSETLVFRNGEKQRIDATELVPGDIVLLASGDKVPADLRLVQVRNLQVDESALTGESVPVEKRIDVVEQEATLGDRVNMAYSSTLVTYGTAVGVVVETGDNTEIGKISELIASAEILDTPLTRNIARFSQILLYAILVLAAITFAVGIWHGGSMVDMFMAAVALAVAMIPEGLPAVVTITLAIGVARMAKRNAIIRRLPAVETLGSTTVICSDKTGTLTRNEMTVCQVWTAGKQMQVTGTGYSPDGEVSLGDKPIQLQEEPQLTELARAGLLCNDSVLKQVEHGWKVEGDPTEGALLVFAGKASLQRQSEADSLPRIDTIPFESEYQYMATLHRGNEAIVYMKGSVERVLASCSTMLSDSEQQQALDADLINKQVETLASQGLRVLAFARKTMAQTTEGIDHADVKEGLEFIGLQGMIDPPRDEAVQAVRACQKAGMRIKMITGDHAITAGAIAGQIGLDERLEQGQIPNTLTGQQLTHLSDEQLIQASLDTAVFARVSPEQKLRLVEALQASGQVTAMTGDGVNDAPALRRADIGVAMGQTGTEVSKEASDMVLTDDNFASIKAAVEEGRGVFDNLLKFITWILPTNAGQGLVIMVAVLLAEPLPVLPVQALWINMTTAVLLGLTLAFEPHEPGIMAREPRTPGTSILSSEILVRIALVGVLLLIGSFGLFEWALYQGASIEQARTIAVNVFAVGQSFYLLNCRSLRYNMFHLGLFSNMWIWVGIGAMAFAQYLFTHNPLMNRLFETAPISLSDWFHIVLVGFAIYVIIGAEKFLRLRQEKRQRPLEVRHS